MERETQYLQKHLLDLSRQAENKNMVTFSNFLNLNEQSILHQMAKDFYNSFVLSGGYNCAERKMAAFVPSALLGNDTYGTPGTISPDRFPIIAIQVEPSHPKFAESFTHRDVLGAIMGTGLKREMLGDILKQDHAFIVLCAKQMSDYLVENCMKIRHTMVQCKQIPLSDFVYEPTFIEKESVVASLRLDTIIADVCKLPRSAAQKIISEGNAFINSQKILRNDYCCQDGDILSVRHHGKFLLETTNQITKKGRIKYKFKIYS